MRPQVSIIVPAYNAADTIGQCMDSVLSQSTTDLELIVVNDGSTDATDQIVSSRDDTRIRLISTDNRGVGHAGNVGLEAATGEYIQYLDADDLLDEEKIASQLRRLADNPPGCSAVCSWARFDDTIDDLKMVRAADWCDLDPYEYLRLNLGGGGTMPVFTWLIPRILAEKAGPWNEALSLREDTEYFTRIAIASSRILFCEDAFGYYRSGLETSLSRGLSMSSAQSILLASRLIEQRFLDAYGDREDSESIVANLYRRGSIQLFQINPMLSGRLKFRHSNGLK